MCDEAEGSTQKHASEELKERERQRAMTPEERLQELMRLNIEHYGEEAYKQPLKRVMKIAGLEDLY